MIDQKLDIKESEFFGYFTVLYPFRIQTPLLRGKWKKIVLKHNDLGVHQK
jgi:hypothetical protein